MKKVRPILVLPFFVFVVFGAAVYAGGTGIKDPGNLPSFPIKSLVENGIQHQDSEPQIYDEPGIFLDIETQYYRDSGKFDTAPDDFRKIVADTDFTPFVFDFRYAVRKNWSPVDCADSCEVMLLMNIDNSGKLLSNEIFRSSGNEIFDKSVLDAVQKSAPFIFMPQEYKFNNLPVWFAFTSVLSKNAFEQNKIKQADFKSYMKNLQKSIKRNWKLPKNLFQGRRTVLFFSVNKQGEVTFCKVLVSSKDEAVDKSALDAVKFAAPFEIFPKTSNNDNIDIIFKFDYNVFEDISKPLQKSVLNCTLTDKSPSKRTLYGFKNKEQKKIFKEYINYVTDRLKTIKSPRTKDSLLRVRFSIDKTGTVKNVKITTSNGNKEFNKAILSQIENMKFKSIPEKLRISAVSVEYQFDNMWLGNRRRYRLLML